MKSMKIEFFFSHVEVDRFVNALSNVTGGDIAFSEIFRGKVMVAEDKPLGRLILLENVPLIDFFFDIKRFLIDNKNIKNSQQTIVDVYESYTVQLTKKNEILTFTELSENQQCIDFNYLKCLHRVKFASQQLYEEMIGFCPKLKNYYGLEKIHKALM